VGANEIVFFNLNNSEMNKASGFFEVFLGVSTGLGKVMSSPPLLFLSGLMAGASSYVDINGAFLYALGVCIFADSVFGVWLARKKGEFDWDKAVRIIEKIVVYSFYMWVIHSITRIGWFNDFDVQVRYLTNAVYSVMIVHEGRSAFRNGHRVHPNKVAGFVVDIFDRIEGKIKLGAEKKIMNTDNLN
jgi:hypothetical protein